MTGEAASHGVAEGERAGERNDEQDVVATIREHGWRQGDILPPALTPLVRMRDGVPLAGATECAIVLNVDCDLVHGRLHGEPVAEVIRARYRPLLDPSLVGLRNPRLLHLPITGEMDASAVELAAYDRGEIDRHHLGLQGPSGDLLLPDGARRVLADWMANRYQRTALPDAFNERVAAGQQKKKLRRLFGRCVAEVLAVYVGLHTMEELGPKDLYHLALRVVMTKEAYDDPSTRSRVDDTFYAPLVDLLNSALGIGTVRAALVSEEDFSLRDLRQMYRLEYDFLSYESDPAGPIAPRAN